LHLHAKGFERVLPKLSGLDLVFCDPPFPWFRDERERLTEMLRLAGAALGPDGLVVIRGERGEDLPEHGLVERDRRDYGRSWIALLQDRGLQPAMNDPDAG
jgi:16S rRNA G966 N2-methylase RsmD